MSNCFLKQAAPDGQAPQHSCARTQARLGRKAGITVELREGNRTRHASPLVEVLKDYVSRRGRWKGLVCERSDYISDAEALHSIAVIADLNLRSDAVHHRLSTHIGWNAERHQVCPWLSVSADSGKACRSRAPASSASGVALWMRSHVALRRCRGWSSVVCRGRQRCWCWGEHHVASPVDSVIGATG
jgi:hypothetical protein